MKLESELKILVPPGIEGSPYISVESVRGALFEMAEQLAEVEETRAAGFIRGLAPRIVSIAEQIQAEDAQRRA